jgi:hypothetical protein
MHLGWVHNSVDVFLITLGSDGYGFRTGRDVCWQRLE